MEHRIRNVSVVGLGFMGQQIAGAAALAGFPVRAFDSDPRAPEKSSQKILELLRMLNREELEARFEDARAKIHVCDTLGEALDLADLVIEAVPESLDLKREVFSKIDGYARPEAFLASNSSSIPATKIETAVSQDRRGKLLNVHFDSPILQRPLVDIMPGSSTGTGVLESLRIWVESIGCVPVIVKKPIMGYLGNRLWRMVKREALKLWAEGYGDVEEIDRAWMLQFDVNVGPFGMMDVVGLDVVYDIEMAYYGETGDAMDRPPPALKKLIEEGNLGMKTGKGFYDWSDPAFLKPGFLRRKE
jgi:3-hydroxybutyryl-CoA dehydrogenase